MAERLLDGLQVAGGEEREEAVKQREELMETLRRIEADLAELKALASGA